MGMEELKRLPAEAGLRRSRRLMKKARFDPAVVIDLDDDEIEEEEEWEPRAHEEVGGKHNEEEEKGRPGGLVGTAHNPISFWPMPEKNVETNAGLEISNGMKEASRAIGIDLTAAPQATEVETNDKKGEISRATGIDLDDPEVLSAIMDDDIMEISFGDANSQQAEVVDLSSSESSDEGDGDINGEIAEEQEEIVTTLSREDAIVFAEVLKVIKEGGDLRKFKLDQLKTYLRHHGLRMFGVKFDLLSRIREHQRIKDRAEEIYPRSSFSINCKGDVCLGDTVLFLQTVYDMPFNYEIRAASGPPLGKRWVAGKVVSESYGAGKQQHTFTIEVLWSTGIQPFYCMRPVKIKGRNLYRMVTMRQPWSNEAERQKVLDEKHARGAAARAIRRGVKGLKSKGKSRADSRVHPYSRPHGAESHGIPPTTTQQNAGIHNPYQGSNLTHIAPTVPLHSSMQHGTYTERTVYQTFIATNNPAPPKTPRRSSHTQQSEAQWNIKHIPAPTHPAHGYPPPMQHGRSFHTQQKECQGNSNLAHNQPPPRAHAQEHGRIHTQRQTSSKHHPNHGRHKQGATHIPCSNTKCENAAAMQCIMKSCAHCCTRNTKKGRCQRHR